MEGKGHEDEDIIYVGNHIVSNVRANVWDMRIGNDKVNTCAMCDIERFYFMPFLLTEWHSMVGICISAWVRWNFEMVARKLAAYSTYSGSKQSRWIFMNQYKSASACVFLVGTDIFHFRSLPSFVLHAAEILLPAILASLAYGRDFFDRI